MRPTSLRPTTPVARTRAALMLTASTLALAGTAALSAACQRAPSEPAPSNTTTNTPPPGSHVPAIPVGANPHANVPGAPGGPAANAPPAAGELAWDDPPGWQRVRPASSMRRAQYRIPHAPGEEPDAELTVITFGPGQGGSTEDNLQRWWGQVTQPDGGSTAAAAQRRTMSVNGMNVTITEVTGRMGGGAAMMPGVPAAALIERGRLLAAIVESPSGPWYFKMTGPDQTVANARPAFEQMLRSLHVSGGSAAAAH